MYGVLFEHASEDIYPDLVGPAYDSIPDATDALITGRAKGYRGVIVQIQR
jgi:hypothetical protein